MNRAARLDSLLLMRPACRTRKGPFLDINPMPPIGMGYLSSSLKLEGVSTGIYDSLIEYWNTPREEGGDFLTIGPAPDEAARLVLERGPDALGLSVSFSNQWPLALETLRAVRRMHPGIVTIVGGPHASVMPLEVLAHECVDYVVAGEGEASLRDVVRHVRGDFDPQSFDGVGFKAHGELHFKPKRTYIQDLDSLPFPDWDAMQIEKYYGLAMSHGMRGAERFMPIVTSRGCPMNCVFCSANSVWGKKHRKRSVENILAEMLELKHRHGIQELLIEDDNLTLDALRAKTLFTRMREAGLDFAVDTPNGVAAWTIDQEMATLMKDAGFRNVNLALESGNQRVLDEIVGKPLSLAKALEVKGHLQAVGIKTGAFFVVGLPGETLAEIQETFDFILEKGFDAVHVSLATPYPGSRLYSICEEKGLFTRPYDLESLFLGSYMLSTADWSVEELRGAVEAGLKRVYGR